MAAPTIISIFISICSWEQEGHECWEFNINTVIQSSIVYESGKLLKKHFILFCIHQKTDSKWKLLKSHLFLIFWIKKHDVKNNHSFSEGNLFSLFFWRRSLYIKDIVQSLSPLSLIIRVNYFAIIIFSIFTSSLQEESELVSFKSLL